MLGGASFDCDDAKIIIGCIGPYAEAIDSLVHEISEIVHVMGGTRFYNGGRSSELIFVTDHAKFQNHNMMLVAALIDCGLLK